MRVPLNFLFADVLTSFVLKEVPFVLLLWSAFNIMCFFEQGEKGKREKEMVLKKKYLYTLGFFLGPLFVCY